MIVGTLDTLRAPLHCSCKLGQDRFSPSLCFLLSSAIHQTNLFSIAIALLLLISTELEKPLTLNISLSLLDRNAIFKMLKSYYCSLFA